MLNMIYTVFVQQTGGDMPGDTKPHKARKAKKRRRTRKTGDLSDLRRTLWQAIYQAEQVLLDADSDTATVLKCVHAISQAAGTYAKVVEVGELEARLAELEKSLGHRSNGRRAYA